jgi:succinyl-diaminopimelate desuccinylase
VPDAELELLDASDSVTNLIARIRGRTPGKRVVFNGHLDTYPVIHPETWLRAPTGEIVGDRLYGRGAADMKGRIAASIAAFTALADVRQHWAGEVVLSLAGDEETMGPLGTRWLMERLPHASGDAVIIGDAGFPQVVRFGEKGFLWLDVVASGKPAHGAHVHLGINAIDRLREALYTLEEIRGIEVASPPEVSAAIAEAKPLSEGLSGDGEADTLGRITINVGQVEGGTSANLVPTEASAKLDIRLPLGVSCTRVEAAIAKAFDRPGLEWRVRRRFEPNFTPPDSELIRACAAAAVKATGGPVAVNMRLGGSDARWFRLAGLPTVVYGPTPFNMGGADEYALLPELAQVAQVHALTALTVLTGEG